MNAWACSQSVSIQLSNSFCYLFRWALIWWEEPNWDCFVFIFLSFSKRLSKRFDRFCCFFFFFLIFIRTNKNALFQIRLKLLFFSSKLKDYCINREECALCLYAVQSILFFFDLFSHACSLVSVSFLFLVVVVAFFSPYAFKSTFIFPFMSFSFHAQPIQSDKKKKRRRVYAVHAHEFTDSVQGKREIFKFKSSVCHFEVIAN